MGIVQEDRFDAPQPQVRQEDHGAVYVEAATETPVATVEPQQQDDEAKEEAPAVKDEKPRKKAGRPKKGKDK